MSTITQNEMQCPECGKHIVVPLCAKHGAPVPEGYRINRQHVAVRFDDRAWASDIDVYIDDKKSECALEALQADPLSDGFAVEGFRQNGRMATCICCGDLAVRMVKGTVEIRHRDGRPFNGVPVEVV